MTKRILALVLAALMAISCFALTACGTEETKDGEDTTTNEGGDNTTTDTNNGETNNGETNNGETNNGETNNGDNGTTEHTFMTYDASANVDTGATYDLLANSYTTATAAEITFTSSDETVATVDANGVITGVKEGEVTITVTIGGKEMATFAVTVTAPWTPTDPESIAVLEAKKNLTKFSYMGWYPVNIASTPAYNPENLTDTTAGPVEVWSDHLQILFKLDKNDCDATIGIDNLETYGFSFMFYYRPYDETNDRGDYEVAALQCWSIGYTDHPIYRCHFYDTLYSGMEVDTEYEVVLVVYNGDEAVGYAESSFTWTDSCEAFVKVAENDSKIVK